MNIKHKLNQAYRLLRFGYRANSETFIRYLRKQGCTIGEGMHFFDPVHCKVDPVRLDYISIGKYTKITSGFTLLAHDYSFSTLIGTHHEILPPGGAYTKIGDNCFIGMNTTILMGVTVGDNVIIAANSVVTKDLPSNAVYGGVPAKQIMTLDEYYQRRKNKFPEDAKRCYEHLKRQFGREPSIRELGFYAQLFLERTEENWKKYIAPIRMPGVNPVDIQNAFFATEPMFGSYAEFVQNMNM